MFSNDVIDEAVSGHPDRFVPFLAVNPWNQADGVAEIHRRADTGYRGVKLHPTLRGYHLSDLGLVGPILNSIRERQLLVICHGHPISELRRRNSGWPLPPIPRFRSDGAHRHLLVTRPGNPLGSRSAQSVPGDLQGSSLRDQRIRA